MTEIEEVLKRVSTVGDKYLMRLISAHRPVIRHAGDQRDPITEISCSCKKEGYITKELGMAYYLHIYDIIRPAVSSLINDTGR